MGLRNIRSYIYFVLLIFIYPSINLVGQMTNSLDSIYDQANYFYKHKEYQSCQQLCSYLLQDEHQASMSDSSLCRALFLDAQVSYRLKASDEEFFNKYGNCIRCFEQLQDTIRLTESWQMVSVRHRKNGNCYKIDSLAEIVAPLVHEGSHEFTKTNFGKLLFYTGSCYFQQGDVRSAIPRYERAERLSQNDQLKYRLFQHLGYMYNIVGNYGKAISYQELCLEDALNKGSDELIGKSYMNLGLSYFRVGRLEEAQESMKNCIKYSRQALGDNCRNCALASSNLGLIQMRLGLFDKSLETFQRAIQEFEKLNLQHTSSYSMPFNNTGIVYSELKDFQKALPYFKKALTISINHTGENSKFSHALEYRNIANCYRELNQFDSARTYYDSTFQVLEFNEQDDETALGIGLVHPLIGALIDKGRSCQLEYEYSDDINSLHEAIQYFDIALDKIRHVRNNSTGDDTENVFAELMKAANEGKLISTISKFELEPSDELLSAALNCMERSKGFDLLKSLQGEKAIKFFDLPPEKIDLIDELTADIIELEHQLMVEKGTSNHDTLIQIRNKLVNKRASRDKLRVGLEKSHPAYYNMKYDIPEVNLKEAQLMLDEHSALIEYFVGNLVLSTMVLTRDTVYWFNESTPTQLSTHWSNWHEYLSNPNTNTKSTHTNLSDTFYHYLLEDQLATIPEINQLIVVPDEFLYYMPFEALTSTTSSGQECLIENYNIAYATSISLLLDQNTHLSQAPKPWVGFVSTYDDIEEDKEQENESIAMLVRDGNYKLPGALSESQQIKDIIGSGASIIEGADEIDFTQLAGKFKILHFAMHSVLNKENPRYSKLIFSQPTSDTLSDNFLHINELFKFKLDADMVVLSACNTGQGKLFKGEGVMSMSKAFAYTGVPSTVMSLWPTPDDATSQLMVDFYRHLKEGESKNTALRKAKLDWLNNDELPQEFKHPFYWSSFIVSGNMQPLSFEQNNWMNWKLGILFLLGFIGLIFLLKRSR